MANDHLSDAVLDALQRDLTIDITTTGASSGKPRRIEIWFMNVDGRIYITGTSRPRHWLANLRANPSFTFHLKESVCVDLLATAHEVVDRDHRRRVFEDPACRWYVEREPIDELVRTAPMVEVTFLPATD